MIAQPEPVPMLGRVEDGDPAFPEVEVGSGVVQVWVAKRHQHKGKIVSQVYDGTVFWPGGFHPLELSLPGGDDFGAGAPAGHIGLRPTVDEPRRLRFPQAALEGKQRLVRSNTLGACGLCTFCLSY